MGAALSASTSSGPTPEVVDLPHRPQRTVATAVPNRMAMQAMIPPWLVRGPERSGGHSDQDFPAPAPPPPCGRHLSFTPQVNPRGLPMRGTDFHGIAQWMNGSERFGLG